MNKVFKIKADQIDSLFTINYKINSLARVLDIARINGDEKATIEHWKDGALGNVISNLAQIMEGLTSDVNNILNDVEVNQKKAPDTKPSQKDSSGA
jgi:hypothetical protein